MTADTLALVAIVGVAVLFLLDCPILKPWSGFRKPKGHRGHWFE